MKPKNPKNPKNPWKVSCKFYDKYGKRRRKITEKNLNKDSQDSQY